MTPKGIKRKIAIAQENIEEYIKRGIDRDSPYSGPLAYEGYNAGYLDALSDVRLSLNGQRPCKRPDWWEKKTND